MAASTRCSASLGGDFIGVSLTHMPDPGRPQRADGRDSKPREGDARPSLFPRGRRWLWILAGLLALNLLLSFATGGPRSRERVPYQPFFVGQVGSGNVKEISSRGDSLEGGVAHKARHDPPGGAEAGEGKRVQNEGA